MKQLRYQVIISELTDIGESAPRLLSRKKDAESIDATNNIMGLDQYDNDILIGGREDQTLSIIRQYIKLEIQKTNYKPSGFNYKFNFKHKPKHYLKLASDKTCTIMYQLENENNP